MYISQEVRSFLDGPWPDPKQELRAGRLRADLEGFIEGRTIAVGWDPYQKDKTAYMARLNPPSDGVWAIRSRDPKPGIRALGCFAARDVFIVLILFERESLDGPNGPIWKAAINVCKAEWRKLFPTYPPISRSDFNDYLSTGFFLV